MPVLVEEINQPSSQDFTDLQKIYQDAPDWLLAPFNNCEQLIAEQRFLAGRFNDRLLGAALLEKTDSCWRLSHLCVRKVTRQRGVARRLLDEAQRLAREAGKPLHLAAPVDHLEAQALAARTGLPLEAL